MSDPGKSSLAKTKGKKATGDISSGGERDTGVASSQKRPRSADDLGMAKTAPFAEPLGAEDLAKMSRSERKRHREQKRRSDVNKGFDELMSLLLEIEPNIRAEAEERALRGQWKGGSGSQEETLLSRVELISRTVEVLRRIHNENEERKRIIASLTQQTRASTMSSAFGMRTPAGPFGQDIPGAVTAAQEVASLFPPLNRSVPDDIALRAAAEASQLYSQSLIDRLSSLGPASQLELLSHRAQSNLLGLSGQIGGGLGPPDSLGLTGRLSNTDIARQLANLSSMDTRALLSGALSGHAGLPQPRGTLSNQQYEYLQLLRERNQPSESSRYGRGEDSETSRFTQGSADRSGRGPDYS